LQKQFEKLEQLFTVDTQVLKNITARFGKELQDGKSDFLLQAFLNNWGS
jgi:hypothetical protein